MKRVSDLPAKPLCRVFVPAGLEAIAIAPDAFGCRGSLYRRPFAFDDGNDEIAARTIIIFVIRDQAGGRRAGRRTSPRRRKEGGIGTTGNHDLSSR